MFAAERYSSGRRAPRRLTHINPRAAYQPTIATIQRQGAGMGPAARTKELDVYSKILVPIDGSSTSERALAEAAQLAQLTGGRLRLLNIVDPLGHINGFEAPALYLNELHPAMVKAAHELVEKAKESLADKGLTVETEVCESRGARVSEMIVECAKNWGAELLVLGTHGRRGIERVLMGSDAELVVRTSPVPVLLVRHKG